MRIGHRAKKKDWCKCGVYEKTSIGDLCAECFKKSDDRTILEKIKDAIYDAQSRRMVINSISVGTHEYYEIVHFMHHEALSYAPRPSGGRQVITMYGIRIDIQEFMYGKILLQTNQGLLEYEA